MNKMLDDLRAAMRRIGAAAYIIFNTDPNNDEYIPREYMVAKALTGFTGDNAIAIITDDFAGLWTDSRFFISGEIEMRQSGFQLMKKETNDDPSFSKFLAQRLNKGDKVCFDGQLVTDRLYQTIKADLDAVGVIIDNDTDLTPQFWKDRPQPVFTDIFVLDDKYSGQPAAQKIAKLLNTIVNDYQVLTRLDDIAWLLNLRAADIDYCPLIRSFLIAGPDGVTLFVHDGRVNGKIKDYLDSLDVRTAHYSDIYARLRQLPACANVRIERRSANSLIVSSVNPKCKIIDTPSPVQQWKAVKNDVELTNFRRAFVLDGVALERFFYKFESKLAAGEPLTELSAANLLLDERKKGEGFISESFECISAFNQHAAMPHYAPTTDSDLPIDGNGVYLVDSGGQYFYGTTDITRTLATTPDGKFAEQFMLDYTLVLQGHIELATAVFPKGSSGSRFEALARVNMWKHGRNYGHGTGHGVGYCLNCHEGPHSISPIPNKVALEPGMIVTDEPGIYIENEYGIRTENMLQVVKSEFEDFYKFDVLTLCHIDTRPIIKDMLTKPQIVFVNDYNQRVFNTLSPYLDEDEKAYLRERTLAI